MSHYAEITLKMNGEPEAIVRALLECAYRSGRKLKREHIEVFAEAQPLRGYHGDVRAQRAHIRIKGYGWGSAENYVGGLSNDIGFERKADGTWAAHISEYDGSYYGETWQKNLLSKWAIQKIGVEAENKGYSWNVEYGTAEGKQFAYVSVNMPNYGSY